VLTDMLGVNTKMEELVLSRVDGTSSAFEELGQVMCNTPVCVHCVLEFAKSVTCTGLTLA
jgi:hypothetical protein